MSPPQLDAVRAAAKVKLAGNKLKDYRAYPKQALWHALGASNNESLLMGANQSGKTLAGAFEMAMHLTGRYPDNWEGRRWGRPIRALAGSESGELTRKGVQRLLLGPPEDQAAWGTGAIPRECILATPRKQGIPNAVDHILVKHVDGGNSMVQFASYDQGRSKWQADTIDLVWFDEEPPEDVYMEGITRTNATRGYVYTTFTPLKGMSAVVGRFWPLPKFAKCGLVIMGINDVGHYTEEDRANILAKYPLHERDARAHGIPQFGSGLIYNVPEESITIAPFPIPPHWKVIGGLDFGWDHPTGAVKVALDCDTDTIYVTAEFRESKHTPVMTAGAVRGWGPRMPWAWPHDGLQHDKGSGEELASLYRDQGLNMLPEKSTFEDGGYGVEAGIMDILDRMTGGRLKIFSTCVEVFEEIRTYHRKNGKIVKTQDDLLCAIRYAIMMLRYAKYAKDKPTPRARGAGNWMA